jgi:hypothetical protein
VADAAGYGTRDRDQRFVPGEALVHYEPGTDASERSELGTITLRLRRR